MAEGRCQTYCYPVFHLQSLIRYGIHYGGDGMHAQLCLTLCDPLDCSPAGPTIHGIFQARILEWVATSYSRGYSQLKDWTRFSFYRLHWQEDSLWLCHGKPSIHYMACLKTIITNAVFPFFPEGVKTHFFRTAISLTITCEHFRSKMPERQNKWSDFFLMKCTIWSEIWHGNNEI